MYIKVLLEDAEERDVKPFQLDKLISSGMIKKFSRSGKWVRPGRDRIREREEYHSGPERRIPSTIRFLWDRRLPTIQHRFPG